MLPALKPKMAGAITTIMVTKTTMPMMVTKTTMAFMTTIEITINMTEIATKTTKKVMAITTTVVTMTTNTIMTKAEPTPQFQQYQLSFSFQDSNDSCNTSSVYASKTALPQPSHQ